MIVPMKKVAIIVREPDAAGAVGTLRRLGVVHLQHQRPLQGPDLASLKDDLAFLDKSLAVLSAPGLCKDAGARDPRAIANWRLSVRRIIDTAARIDQLEEHGRRLAADIAAWEAWGDFDPASLAALRARGIVVRLFRVPAKEVGTLAARIAPAILRQVAAESGQALCAVIARERADVPYPELAPPRMGPAEMRMRLTENDDAVRALKETIRRFACYRERFGKIRDAFARELELHEAIRGMGQAGQLAYLVGFAPAEASAALYAEAARSRWGIAVSDPAADDDVPTLIRNPCWVSLIAPVFKLIEIVPGYRELDISPVFLLFLALFFGMIIGDAGYGALYIAVTALAHMKWGRAMKDKRVFFLLYLFNASAILWGLATGTVFGHEWYVAGGRRALVPALNDTKSLQAFCFFLGAFHLTIAQGWQGIRKLPSLSAAADAGWISIIWAAFLLARMLILGDPLPGFTRWLIIAGVALVVIGTAPQRNIFKMAGAGLGAVALNIMNNFTDVVSYIRLFAVGLAGVAIADTVNTLAAESGNIFVGTLIVFAGHTINMVLGPMSVLVHGIRLNVLEFSGHAGLTWTGTAYRPLKD